jgi:hypothetical protein
MGPRRAKEDSQDATEHRSGSGPPKENRWPSALRLGRRGCPYLRFSAPPGKEAVGKLKYLNSLPLDPNKGK